MPLLILHPANEGRFEFTDLGQDRAEGTATVKVGFRELRAPTLIKAGTTDCFASGTFWIARDTGAVVQAKVACGNSAASSDPITVRYRHEKRLSLWLPFEAAERSGRGIGRGTKWLEATCRYSNYRRFETDARLVVPSKQPHH